MYKLVVMDCDGTLIDGRAFIPEDNLREIKRLSAQGIKFMIATGRNDLMVHDYIDELGISSIVIGCNGASLRDLATGELFACFPIPDESLKRVLDYCMSVNAFPKLCSASKVYVQAADAVGNKIKEIFGTYEKVLTKNLDGEVVKSLYSLIGNKDKIIKVTLVEQDIDKLLMMQKQLSELEDVNVCRSSKNCVDIMLRDISKGRTLNLFAEKFGYARDEIVAIGDGENDVDMLEFAGYGVAMGNSHGVTLAVADFVTRNNDEAGVAFVLRKIFGE